MRKIAYSNLCHSSCRVPSKVLQLAVATADLHYETYIAGWIEESGSVIEIGMLPNV